MRGPGVFCMELAAAVANRRSLTLRLGIPLLLGAPFVLFGMPLRARTVGLAMLVMFTSLFGAAVGIARRRREGLLEKLRLTPLPRPLVLSDLLLAGTLVDLLQTGPVIGLFVCIYATKAGLCRLPALATCLVGTVFMLNLLGVLLASGLRSNQEVHLAGALSVGAVAFLSGLFPVPEHLAGLVDLTAPWSPTAWLASLLEATAGGGPGPGRAALAAAFLSAGVAVALLGMRAIGWPAPRLRR